MRCEPSATFIRQAICVVLSFFLACAGANAQPSPATAPATRPTTGRAPSGDYELHEWVILVCDAARPEANAAALFPSALPAFAKGTRPMAAAAVATTQPSPIGLIRLLGSPPSDAGKVDVLLEVHSGRFGGHWPPSKSRGARLLWDGLELLQESAGAEAVPAGHWYAGLRNGPAAHLRRGRAGERFLLYDVEMNNPSPLRVAVGGGGGTDPLHYVSNVGPAALLDLQMYKPVDGRWRTAGLARLDVSTAPATVPATAPATAPATVAATAPATAPATVPSTTVSTRPATAPATVPAGTALPFASGSATTAAEALAPWRSRLAAAGLPPTDLPVILSILEHHALDARRSTAVYRLAPSEMDRLLPLEVTPAPRRTVRVGLVIVRNVGPELAEEIGRLIAQLGDDDWARREDAFKQLRQLGPAAQAQLQEAAGHRDLEIAWRAERLMAILTPRPQ